MTFHVVLIEPEIPPNTGNIIRLCANTGARLHLVHPLGFSIDDRRLRRAGLDYHEFADVVEHASYAAFISNHQPARVFACSTRGVRKHTDSQFEPGDAFVFGPETRGLQQAQLDAIGSDQILRIPMLADSRSLNLSNAVAIVLYEALRQTGFRDLN